MHILGAAARFDNPLPQQSVDHPSMVRRAGTGFGNCRTGAAVHTLDPLGHVWISITLMDRAREAWCVVCAQTQTLSQSAVPPAQHLSRHASFAGGHTDPGTREASLGALASICLTRADARKQLIEAKVGGHTPLSWTSQRTHRGHPHRATSTAPQNTVVRLQLSPT